MIKRRLRAQAHQIYFVRFHDILPGVAGGACALEPLVGVVPDNDVSMFLGCVKRRRQARDDGQTQREIERQSVLPCWQAIQRMAS